MQEANYSFNIKFNLEGFDSQFTVRSDTTGTECIDLGCKAIQVLKIKGAIPDRRWEAVNNGNNKVNATTSARRQPPSDASPFPDEQPSCPTCGQSDQLELIQWTDKSTGAKREELKCQRCKKWLPSD